MGGKSAGRGGSNWRRLVADQKAKRSVCYICGQKIDYDAEYPAPESFTVDHIKSWIHHPELREDPANLASAHARCNKSKGKGEAPITLGMLSEDWSR